MRLVDADALMDMFRGEEGAKALDHFALRLIKVKKIVDEAPTIDAIPIEWLHSQLKNNPNDIESAYDDICINELIDRWHKGQEGER